MIKEITMNKIDHNLCCDLVNMRIGTGIFHIRYMLSTRFSTRYVHSVQIAFMNATALDEYMFIDVDSHN